MLCHAGDLFQGNEQDFEGPFTSGFLRNEAVREAFEYKLEYTEVC